MHTISVFCRVRWLCGDCCCRLQLLDRPRPRRRRAGHFRPLPPPLRAPSIQKDGGCVQASVDLDVVRASWRAPSRGIVGAALPIEELCAAG